MTNYETLRMRLNKLRHYIFGKKFYKKIHFNFSNDFMRWNLINKIIQKKGFTSYLEIGCYQDETFSKVKIEKKVGVDPISGGTLRQTSDAFFSTNRDFFDLIFIDGHHVYDQVIKDINNSIKSKIKLDYYSYLYYLNKSVASVSAKFSNGKILNESKKL